MFSSASGGPSPASLAFTKKELFGGAIVADLPSAFFDASNIRQVPDNQEVFLDADGFSSVHFDILERVDECADDEAALMFHLFDIADEKDRLCVSGVETVHLGAMPSTPAYAALASTKPSANKEGGKDVTALFVLLVRLGAQDTDIVVSVNLPYRGTDFVADVVDPLAEPRDPLLAKGLRIMATVLSSLEIKDWGLFGEA